MRRGIEKDIFGGREFRFYPRGSLLNPDAGKVQSERGSGAGARFPAHDVARRFGAIANSLRTAAIRDGQIDLPFDVDLVWDLRLEHHRAFVEPRLLGRGALDETTQDRRRPVDAASIEPELVE